MNLHISLQNEHYYSRCGCRWLRGGVEVGAGPVLRLGGEEGQVSRRDQGTYTCTAENRHGAASTQVGVYRGQS